MTTPCADRLTAPCSKAVSIPKGKGRGSCQCLRRRTPKGERETLRKKQPSRPFDEQAVDTFARGPISPTSFRNASARAQLRMPILRILAAGKDPGNMKRFAHLVHVALLQSHQKAPGAAAVRARTVSVFAASVQ